MSTAAVGSASFRTLDSGAGGSNHLISDVPIRWPEWRRACCLHGRGHNNREYMLLDRRKRVRSWQETALRRSTKRTSKLAPNNSRARRPARPLHPTAACRKLTFIIARGPIGPPPRNANLGEPPIWGPLTVPGFINAHLCRAPLAVRPCGHVTNTPTDTFQPSTRICGTKQGAPSVLHATAGVAVPSCRTRAVPGRSGAHKLRVVTAPSRPGMSFAPASGGAARLG